ncbi:hypothetical protein B0H19DRAFT_1242679 [Mycena capillaripes]|nr:hypothetical protein B0H19DRAFT_1242679 [Mycena capillaripes]
MLFAASIALASFIAFSKITVNSAPLNVRTIVQQACTGPTGRGTCIPLRGTNGTLCTNTPGLQSLLLNRDADCSAFPQPNCKFDPVTEFVIELFSDDSDDLGNRNIQSVQCAQAIGTVNGFTAGSDADIAQEKADFAAANGLEVDPLPHCTEGPVTATPEEQAQADANGITLSGPVTCTFS